MTKKVISIIFLIVTSLIFATSVFAAESSVKDFDVLFYIYEAPKVEVKLKDMAGKYYSDEQPLLIESNTAQCKILFDSNTSATAKVTFYVFKLETTTTETSTTETTPIITYTIKLSKTNTDGTGSVVVDGYSSLSVEDKKNGATGGSFTIDEGISEYPLEFKIDSDNAAPGTYVANIVVTTASS